VQTTPQRRAFPRQCLGLGHRSQFGWGRPVFGRTTPVAGEQTRHFHSLLVGSERQSPADTQAHPSTPRRPRRRGAGLYAGVVHRPPSLHTLRAASFCRVVVTFLLCVVRNGGGSSEQYADYRYSAPAGDGSSPKSCQLAGTCPASCAGVGDCYRSHDNGSTRAHPTVNGGAARAAMGLATTVPRSPAVASSGMAEDSSASLSSHRSASALLRVSPEEVTEIASRLDLGRSLAHSTPPAYLMSVTVPVFCD